MSKRYMDFVPSKPVNGSAMHQQKTVKKTETVEKAVSAPRVTSVKKAEALGEPVLGIVEDREPRFVKAETPKKALNKVSHFRPVKNELTEAKAKRIGNQMKKVEPVAKKAGEEKDKKTYQPPKTPFINQEKVVKRPLSKNVYRKKIEVPKEEPKGPVTIITKPEKDAHVSLIVTIILTIILGAAAGTVAFLLLPK